MNLRYLFIHLLLFGSIQAGHCQPPAYSDDLQASSNSCRIIQMTLNARERMRARGDVPEGDEFSVAGKACQGLATAVSAGDTVKIQSAAKALRPLLASLGMPPSTPREQLEAVERKSSGLKGEELFYSLPDLAKRAFNAGEMSKAETYAKQLLQTAPQYRDNWNYGNAVFFGNMVLGLVAVRDGELEEAGRYLLASAATTGSPQLDSFGPNMTLPKELLEKHQSEVVLKFLGLCKHFWEMDNGRLDQWSSIVRNGGVPDFGASLDY